MHNFPLLFLCEKEKNQNTSDMYCKKYRKMLDYAHRHKTSDKYKKTPPEFPEMSDEKYRKAPVLIWFSRYASRSAVPSWGIMRMPRVKKHKYIGR